MRGLVDFSVFENACWFYPGFRRGGTRSIVRALKIARRAPPTGLAISLLRDRDVGRDSYISLHNVRAGFEQHEANCTFFAPDFRILGMCSKVMCRERGAHRPGSREPGVGYGADLRL